MYIIYSFAVSVFVVMIENMACFAYINFIALFLILTSVSTIYFYDIREFSNPKSDKRGEILHYNFKEIPAFIGLSLFAMEGIGMVFPIRSTIKEVANYRSVFNKVLLFVFIVCAIFGFLTYSAFGKEIEEVIFFTFDSSYQILFILEIGYASGIFFSYTMYLHPIFDIIQHSKRFQKHFNHINVSPFVTAQRDKNRRNRRIMRLLVLVIVYIGCFLGPNLIHLLSFAGSLFNSCLGFIIPIIAYNKYFKEKGKLRPLMKCFNIFILIVGSIFCLISVCVSALGLFGIKIE